MGNLMEIIGSTAIGGFIILMIMQFNSNLVDDLQDSLYYLTTQYHSVTATQIIEYDFYKIGFRDTTSNTILSAKIDEVKFLADLENDGSLETICYYLGDSKNVKHTTNPNDKPLYREINEDKTGVVANVIDFELKYYKSDGTEFVPVNQSDRNKIKSVEIYANFESTEPHANSPQDTVYQGQEITRKFLIRN